MASAPSERGGSGAAENPVDRALGCLIDGDAEGALSWAGARLAAAPTDAVALLLCSRIVGERGDQAVARGGLEASVALATDAGNLPVAVAACRELARLGADPDGHYAAVAAAFARGSDRLAPRQTTPPAMAGAATEPLPVDSLDAVVKGAITTATAAAKQLAERTGAAPKVAPQLLFSSLDVDGLRAMIEVFDVTYVGTGSVLIEQATVGAEAFVVARGELDVRRVKPDGSDLLLARLGAGALFGEMALLSRAPRAASVIASRPSIILVATQKTLDVVAEGHPQVGHEFAAHCRGRMVSNLVRTSPIFSAIDQNERLSIMYQFVTRTFEPGQRLIRQGEETDGLHMIASGEVEVVHHEGDDENLHIAELGVGEVVGEMGLVLRRPANADVLAKVPTVTLHLPRDGFFDLVKEHPAVLGQLYALAVKRDEETASIVAAEADSADSCLIL
jgi:CRP-like cAMP-binding protein